MTADQLMECRDAFEKWLPTTQGWKTCKMRGKPFSLRSHISGEYADFRVNDRWHAYLSAWNTRPTAVASHAEGEVALSYIIGQMRIQADHDFKNGLESASTRVGHWADELDRIRTLDPRWHIAGQVREKLDQACCPDHWMRVAVETITAMTIHCPPRSGDEARDAARYRWLRDLPRNYDGRKNGFHVTLAKAKDKPREWFIETMRGLDLDQAIDAAMASRGDDK